MTDHQWHELLAVIAGNALPRPPIGFIIDCPWLPNWFGIDILDYFTNEALWFEANRKAIETFPEVTFLPGFWSEFGMCTEPSAFGSRCICPRNEFPFAEKILTDNPRMKIIYSSGYPMDVLGRDFFQKDGIHFLQKPYHPHNLAKILRECLDGVSAPAADR